MHQQLSPWLRRRRLFLVCLTFLFLFPSYLAIPSRDNSFFVINPVQLNEKLKGHGHGTEKLPDQSIKKRLSDLEKDSYSDYAGLQHFIDEVFTGEKGVIRGVYVPGIFAYPIIQQPKNNDIYVANKTGLVTQFHQADQNGVTALLAHNYLSGKDFYNLEINQDIWIVYGDREIRHYQVTDIHKFQKLDPSNLYSHLIDLHTYQELTTKEVFNQFYRGSHHLVFQTCLAGEERLDWGLLFVTALPLNQ